MSYLRSILNLKYLPIIAIIGVSILVRIIGLGFGLPDDFRPDERGLVETAVRFGMTGDFNPHRFDWPNLFFYLLFIIYLIAFSVYKLIWGIQWFQFWQVPLSDFGSMQIYLARWVTVLLGIGNVYVLYRLSKELYGKQIGLVAAALLALTYLHVRDSHFGTTDVPVTCFFFLAVLFATRIILQPFKINYLLSGLFIGLAAGMKYNAGIVIISLLTSHFLLVFTRSVSAPLRHQYSYNLILSIIIAGIVFLITTPYAILDYPKFVSDFIAQTKHLRQGHHNVDLGLGLIYHLKFTLYYGLGLPYLVVAGLGILWAVWKRTAADYVLLIQAVFYYIWIGSGKTVFVRYMVPLVPLLAIFTARIVVEGVMMVPFRNIKTRNIMIFIVAVMVISGSVWNIYHFDYLLLQKDTRTLAKEWINNHIPVGTKIAMEPWHGKPQVDHSRYRLIMLGSKGSSHAWLNPEYIAQISDVDKVQILIVDYHPLFYSINPKLLIGYQPGKILAEFRPIADNVSGFGSAVFDPIDAFYIPYARFNGYVCGGPWIRIFWLEQ